MRLSFLVLSLLALTSSTEIDHEAEAKRFFGAVANKIHNNQHGDLFDLIQSKWEHLYPGWITAEEMKQFRSAFVAFREKQERDEPFLSVPALRAAARSMDNIEKEIKKRVFWHVNSEGKRFIRKVFASVPTEFSGTAQIGPLTPKFDAFRAEYEALGESARKQLAKQFGVFAHMDEVLAHIVVFDNLLGAAMTACDNLPGFIHCDQLKKGAAAAPSLPAATAAPTKAAVAAADAA